jgi:hypothetical protein
MIHMLLKNPSIFIFKITFSNFCTAIAWLIVSFGLSSALYIKLKVGYFDEMGVLFFAVLTIMTAITSLIYSRVRAWSSCSTQRRCLYAAEKCFAGTLLVGLTWAVVFSIGAFIKIFDLPLGINFWVPILIAIFILTMLGFKYFIDGIKIVTHRTPWDKKPRKFLKPSR